MNILADFYKCAKKKTNSTWSVQRGETGQVKNRAYCRELLLQRVKLLAMHVNIHFTFGTTPFWYRPTASDL